MAKESKSPAGETILEQQKRGVNTVSSMAQVGVGLSIQTLNFFLNMHLRIHSHLNTQTYIGTKTITSVPQR